MSIGHAGLGFALVQQRDWNADRSRRLFTQP